MCPPLETALNFLAHFYTVIINFAHLTKKVGQPWDKSGFPINKILPVNSKFCQDHYFLSIVFGLVFLRFCSNIKSKSSNNTHLNIIKSFNKLFKKLNIIESQNLITTLTQAK